MLPTPSELQKAWEDIQRLHTQYLAVHEVIIPKVDDYAAHNRSLQLAVLWHYRDREVHKDEVSAIAQRDRPGAATDQQIRHLKRDGWDIGPKPGRHKLNPFRPSQEFVNENARKRMRLGAEDFESVKQAFGGRCATCGATEGEPDPRYGSNVVRLQRGHRDPHEAGDDPENIIPQCQFCNQAYRNDFVFDEKGRATAVASVRPVSRASSAVQREIRNLLCESEERESHASSDLQDGQP